MRWARRVLSHPAFTGISGRHLHLLIGEVYPVWLARREGWLHTRRGGQRRRAAGAGRCARLRFADRLLVTLAHLRLAVPHDALAVVFGVDRFTLTRAIGQGPAVAGQPRLRAALRDPATHPGRRVRLRRRRRRHAAHGRHRDPDPPTAGRPVRSCRVRPSRTPSRPRSAATPTVPRCGAKPTGPAATAVKTEGIEAVLSVPTGEGASRHRLPRLGQDPP